MTQTTLTTTATTAQLWTIPSDWNSGANTIEGIAAGGTGSARISTSVGGVGGGGGAYGIVSNLAPAATGKTVGYFLPAGGSTSDLRFWDLNTLSNSHIPGSTSWNLNNATATTGQSDSTGGTEASKFTENTTAGVPHGTFQTVSGKPASTAFTACAYGEFKDIAATFVAFTIDCGTIRKGIHLKLADGTYTTYSVGSGATLDEVVITSLGNGWYGAFIVVSWDATVTGTTINWVAYRSNGSTDSLTGSGADSFYVGRPNLNFGNLNRGYTRISGTTSPWALRLKCGGNATTTTAGVGGTGVFGDTTTAGGAGFKPTSGATGGGGGGAAGPTGTGTSATSTAGGAADGGTVAGGSAGNAGNSGTEWTSVGAGSGGGGASTGSGLAGGNYGGGGSGASSSAAGNVGGTGAPSLIVINYTAADALMSAICL